MNFLIKGIFTVLVIVFIFACASTTSNTGNTKPSGNSYQPTTVLELLRTIPGVTVAGNRVSVSNGQVLYIVNGSRMNLQTLISTTPVYDIKSARLSKDLTDIRLYTTDITITGIIFITTK